MIIEYFSANLWQLWTLIFFVCLILEVFSGDFFIMSFAIGALAGILTAAIGLNFTIQVVCFAILSLLSLLFIRPVVLHHLHRGEDSRVSNADAIIGREGRVSQSIETGGYGRVAIDGDDWKACSVTGEAIDEGTRVRVVKMESIIVTVEPV